MIFIESCEKLYFVRRDCFGFEIKVKYLVIGVDGVLKKLMFIV